MTLEKRLFGKQRTPVSQVGIGCWQFSDDWGTIGDEQAERILEVGSENGVDFIDTADVYGMGRSETIVGRFLKKRTEKRFFVATKIGRRPDIYPDKYSEATMTQHVEGCLRRLGVEALDLAQLHCIPFDELKKGLVFEVLEKLKREGKIRRFGASVETVEEALFCLRQPELDSLQVIFNVFRLKMIDEVFPLAEKQNVGVIARVPLASGVLSGKFGKETRFASHDHRNYNRDGEKFNVGETFAGIPFEKALELAESLKAICPAGMGLASMALRWILDFPAVTTVIPGASSAGQAEANALAGTLEPLDASTHRRIRDLYETSVKQHVRGPY